MADYEEEEEVLIEIESEDSDFVEEHGEPVACAVQKVFCNEKIPDTTQQYQNFYSRCSVRVKSAILSSIMGAARILCQNPS